MNSIQEGLQPVHYAAVSGRLDILQLLIEDYGISPNAPTNVMLA